jgi:hypothetical protein
MSLLPWFAQTTSTVGTSPEGLQELLALLMALGSKVEDLQGE